MDMSAVLRRFNPCASTALGVDAGAPGFGQPWHAQAFGTAMALAQAGAFDWATWVETFSNVIRAHPQRESESSEDAYYRQWLAALETLTGRSGLISATEIQRTAEHWRRSYLNTPHGKPVELSREWPAVDREHHDDHHHDHGHEHAHHHGAAQRASAPIAISTAIPPVQRQDARD